MTVTMDSHTGPGPSDTWKIAMPTVANFALALTLVHVNGLSSHAISLALRITARVSFVYFFLVFIASPLHTLMRSRLSAILMRNRRVLGIVFGVSMSIHASFIVTLFVIHAPNRPPQIQDTDFSLGIPGILYVAFMTATSFDALRRWLDSGWWKGLQTAGLYIVWYLFFICLVDSEEHKSPAHPWLSYFPIIAALIGAMVLRLAATAQQAHDRPVVAPSL